MPACLPVCFQACSAHSQSVSISSLLLFCSSSFSFRCEHQQQQFSHRDTTADKQSGRQTGHSHSAIRQFTCAAVVVYLRSTRRRLPLPLCPVISIAAIAATVAQCRFSPSHERERARRVQVSTRTRRTTTTKFDAEKLGRSLPLDPLLAHLLPLSLSLSFSISLSSSLIYPVPALPGKAQQQIPSSSTFLLMLLMLPVFILFPPFP